MKSKNMHLAKTLDKYLRLSTYPIAIKLASEELEMPDYHSPIKRMGKKIAVCQAVAITRRLGWKIHYTKKDHVCPGSYIIFGYNKIPDILKEGKGFHYPIYSSTPAAGQKANEYLPTVEIGSINSLFMSPVIETSFIPDVVLVYGNAAQVVRMIQAVVYVNGEIITSSFLGRGACAASIVIPHKTGKCNVVIPGGGERLFALTEDTELLFAIPYNMCEIIIEGIIKTHKSGVSRIPTPYMGMTVEPQFPEQYQDVVKSFQDDFPIKS